MSKEVKDKNFSWASFVDNTKADNQVVEMSLPQTNFKENFIKFTKKNRKDQNKTIGGDLKTDLTYSIFKLQLQYRACFITMRALVIFLSVLFVGVNILMLIFLTPTLMCKGDGDAPQTLFQKEELFALANMDFEGSEELASPLFLASNTTTSSSSSTIQSSSSSSVAVKTTSSSSSVKATTSSSSVQAATPTTQNTTTTTTTPSTTVKTNTTTNTTTTTTAQNTTVATNTTVANATTSTQNKLAVPETIYDEEYHLGYIFLLLVIYHGIEIFSNAVEIYQLKERTHMEFVSMAFTLNACFGCVIFILLNIAFFREMFHCDYSSTQASLLFYWVIAELGWFYISCLVSIVLLLFLLFKDQNYSAEFTLRKNKQKDDFYRKQMEFED